MHHVATLSRLRRVAGMGFGEIRDRGRQESFKWIDRIRLDDRRTPNPAETLRRHAPSLADPVMALRALRTTIAGRGFAGIASDAIAEIQARFPETCGHIQQNAAVLGGRHFDLLGYRRLWFGNPIDWQLDPVHSRRAPLVHWSRLNPLDASSVGDSKIVWELSRHQWVVQLAQACVFSGDQRHASAAIGAIEQWIDANPTGYGINWASSLEVAMRLMSWSWVLLLLRETQAISGGTASRVLASIHAHAAHVLKYLSHHFSPNTHLTGEALGLFYAGTLFREFRDADKWRAAGADTLIAQADRQISDDGVYFEQSTCYQRYTCEIYLHFLVLAAQSGYLVPDRTREHVERMVDFLVAIRRPDGSVPAIGDADGGALMPLVPRAPEDFRGVFALAAAVFGRPDFAWAAGDLTPEVIWLLGRNGANAFARAGQAPPAAPSRVFTSGGYAVMRSDWRPDAHQLIVDVGPIGSHGHGHADLLSIQGSIFGESCLVDAGTYDYTSQPEWRDYFRSTAAHNTVMVDGESQAEPAGPFGWQQRPRVTLREFRSTPAFDLLDAEHNGYVALKTPVIHRRCVLFVKPDFWILIDDLTGDGTHTADLSFHFASLQVSLASGLTARAETTGGSVLWISPTSTAPLEVAIACGQVAPIRGWHSPDYGRRVATPTLTYSAAGSLPMRILTVLYPDRNRLSSAPVIHALYDADGLPSGVRLEPANVSVQLDGPNVQIERG